MSAEIRHSVLSTPWVIVIAVAAVVIFGPSMVKGTLYHWREWRRERRAAGAFRGIARRLGDVEAAARDITRAHEAAGRLRERRIQQQASEGDR